MKAALPALLALVAPLALIGCMETPEAPPPNDVCGASKFAHVVGTPHTEHDFSGPKRTVRIIPPDSMVTLDYREDRLNVSIDKKGIVKDVYCG